MSSLGISLVGMKFQPDLLRGCLLHGKSLDTLPSEILEVVEVRIAEAGRCRYVPRTHCDGFG